jgi:hypothetical protein
MSLTVDEKLAKYYEKRQQAKQKRNEAFQRRYEEGKEIWTARQAAKNGQECQDCKQKICALDPENSKHWTPTSSSSLAKQLIPPALYPSAYGAGIFNLDFNLKPIENYLNTCIDSALKGSFDGMKVVNYTNKSPSVSFQVVVKGDVILDNITAKMLRHVPNVTVSILSIQIFITKRHGDVVILETFLRNL